MIIVDDSMVTKCAPGVKGNILVRGAPCFGGYENNGSANEESFFTVDGLKGKFRFLFICCSVMLKVCLNNTCIAVLYHY